VPGKKPYNPLNSLTRAGPRAEAKGLRIVEAKVTGAPGSIEFCESACAVAGQPSCTIVVNAMGLAGGPECYPVRGQLVLVKAPYVKVAMGEYAAKDRSYPTYIYPRRDHVVLGSTYLERDGDREIREETTSDVIRRCSEFIPELLEAPILSEVVCIRPGRSAGVRLETEQSVKSGGGARYHVIHNYGHGGAGMSLAWGCAGEVVQLARRASLAADPSLPSLDPSLPSLDPSLVPSGSSSSPEGHVGTRPQSARARL